MNIRGWLITALLFHFVMFDWLALSWFAAFLFWKSGCAQTAGCSFARLKKLNIDSAPHTTTPRCWLQSPVGLAFLSPLIFVQTLQVKRGIQNCVNNQFNLTAAHEARISNSLTQMFTSTLHCYLFCGYENVRQSSICNCLSVTCGFMASSCRLRS